MEIRRRVPPVCNTLFFLDLAEHWEGAGLFELSVVERQVARPPGESDPTQGE